MKQAWVRGFTLCLLLPLACQQEMGVQPSYRPLKPAAFFPDGRSARPLLPGTVARGQTRDDQTLLRGKHGAGREAVDAVTLLGLVANGPLAVAALLPPLWETLAVAEYVTTFPYPLTAEVLERGQQRYTIFCAVCHAPTGDGTGKIVQRGYTHPPSYLTDYSRGLERRGMKILLRDVPVGYYFEVISKGYGAMPDYAAAVPPRDRWAIIAYIRALQLSQHARVNELPEGEQQAARKALEGHR